MIKKLIFAKKLLTIVKNGVNIRLKAIMLILMAAIATSGFAGCSGSGTNDSTNTATTDTASNVEMDYTVATLSEKDDAIVDAGLNINEDGKIVDELGNEVEESEDGKVEVKTEDGKTITVDADEVKTANDNKKSTNSANKAAAEKSASAKNNNTNIYSNDINSSKNNTSKNSSSSSNKSSNSSSKNNSTNKGSSNSSNKNNNSNKNNASSSSSSNNSNKNSSSTTNKNNNNKNNSNSSNNSNNSNKNNSNSSNSSGKTWHEAEYKTIYHPAETKKVWVVDKEAYTYEEPIYEKQGRTICNDCGADITDLDDNTTTNHLGEHLWNGGKGSYHDEWRQVQVGTKTVTVPEEGHYETKVVKEAWTEKILVKEAGYY